MQAVSAQNFRVPGLTDLSETVSKLAFLLITLQILDFFFTAFGITVYGTGSEGNHMMRTLMEHFGPYRALFICKCTAILLVAFLATQAKEIKIIKSFLGFSTCFYFFAAILPWASILGNFLAEQI